jgi:fatty-acid desaturase
MILKTKLNIIHGLNHCAFLYFLFTTTNYWLLLISFLIYNLILIVGVSGGLHRYFTHKSFNTSKFWENVMLMTSVPATLGTPLTWIAGHRLHHAYSDTDKDPHSPNSVGFINSYVHNWQELKVSSSIISDIMRNKTARFIHNHYIKSLFIYAVVLYLIDPTVGIICYSIPAVFIFHVTGFVDSICHMYGYRNSDTNDYSKNNTLINLLSVGEGLHNNHHGAPASPKFSVNKYEVDLTWYFIKMIGSKK